MQFTNSWKVTAIVGVTALAIGYGSALLTVPAKVITKTQVVEKTVVADNKDKVTTETTIKKPDGTVITQDKTEDIDDVVTSNTESVTTDKTVINNSKPNWMVSAAYGLNSDGGIPTTAYGGAVQRRLFGPVFFGVSVNTTKNTGLTGLGVLSIEF